MSFNSFMKAMLSEDMLELGFRHYKGSEWYKLIDDSVYLNVSATKLSFGGIELRFHICFCSRSICAICHSFTAMTPLTL